MISKTRQKWVENKLTTIRNLVNESNWVYVPTRTNPADIPHVIGTQQHYHQISYGGIDHFN